MGLGPGRGGRLVHPDDRGWYLDYDEPGGRLTPSRALADHLLLVIPTPASKTRMSR